MMGNILSDYILREVSLGDLDDIARIHIASFSDRALSRLGKGTVKRYYYFLLTGFPDAYPICVVTSGNIMAGFCFAGVYSGSFSGFLGKYKCYLVGNILLHPWMIFNPIVWEQSVLAIRTLTSLLINKFKVKPREVLKINKPLQNTPPKFKSWGILSIAVDPDYQRRGLAEAMMRSVEELVISKGISSLNLSVHIDNISAVQFYEKIGWKKIPSGEGWTGKMVKRLM